MSLGFGDLLTLAGVASDEANVILHSPRVPSFAAMLPGLLRERRTAFKAYQAAHSPGAEAALSRGRNLVASFVRIGRGERPGGSEMLFLGLFRNPGARDRRAEEVRSDPDVRWLKETFGVYREFDDMAADRPIRWFDLVPDPRLSDLVGRLSIGVRLTQTYVRLAERLPAPVVAITAQSRLDASPPPWREMTLSASLVRALPHAWASRLAEWRGVYLIVDEFDGARYVGSACGSENLLGRWRDHVAGDAGVTRALSRRDPAGFRFSILERVSPDMAAAEIVRLEHTWMERLHTRDWGLNT